MEMERNNHIKYNWKYKKSFLLKKRNEEIENRIVRAIRTLFEQEEKDYYKLIRVGKFWNNNYIEYDETSTITKRILR